MGRGKIEIKRIENPTNRQVTYSKRRAGITKKARELAVLCDAQVSLIMFSTTGKLSEYCSPSTSPKEIYDRYQRVSDTNLWDTHYERMQSELSSLKEENNRLQKLIRQKMGEELNELRWKDLRDLEQNLEEWVKRIRDKKNQLLTNQTDTCRKRINKLEAENNTIRLQMEEEVAHCFDDETDCESTLVLGSRNMQLFTYLQPENRQNLRVRGFPSED
ncbi:hypothetical protein AMTRI_Chr06g201330 [Amborella trichopoda]